MSRVIDENDDAINAELMDEIQNCINKKLILPPRIVKKVLKNIEISNFNKLNNNSRYELLEIINTFVSVDEHGPLRFLYSICDDNGYSCHHAQFRNIFVFVL